MLRVVLYTIFVIAWIAIGAAVFNFVNPYAGIAVFGLGGWLLWKAAEFMFKDVII